MTNAFSDPFADLTAGLTEQDRQLARQIARTPVPPVPAEEIYAVCKTAAAYYCPAQSCGVLRVVWGCMRTRFSFLGALGAFLLASGTAVWALCARQCLDPLALMTALAPCPVLAFIIRELQIRDQNLAALEKVCKYSPRTIMLMQLWMYMGLYAMLLLGLGAAVMPTVGLVRMYCCAFTSLFLVGGTALLLLPFLSGALPLSLLLAGWVLGASHLLAQPEIICLIMAAAQGLMLGGTVFSGIFFAAAAAAALRKQYA